MPKPANDERLTSAECQQIRNLVNVHTLNAVANDFKVAPQTLARALAGVNVHRGSLMVIRAALAAREK